MKLVHPPFTKSVIGKMLIFGFPIRTNEILRTSINLVNFFVVKQQLNQFNLEEVFILGRNIVCLLLIILSRSGVVLLKFSQIGGFSFLLGNLVVGGPLEHLLQDVRLHIGQGHHILTNQCIIN